MLKLPTTRSLFFKHHVDSFKITLQSHQDDFQRFLPDSKIEKNYEIMENQKRKILNEEETEKESSHVLTQYLLVGSKHDKVKQLRN